MMCPRCKTELRIRKLVDLDKKTYRIAYCPNCRFAVVLDALPTSACITEEHVKRLPDDLKTEILEGLRAGLVRWEIRYSLETGEQTRCLEPVSDEGKILISRVLEVLRRT